jgi:uncharacterized protein GlcG (DUF336 family)
MVIVKSGTAVSTAANTVSAEQVSGTYEFVGKGFLRLYAKGSATGMNVSLKIAGMPIVDDQAIVGTGTAGTISTNDNMMAEAAVNGGRVSLLLRNTTAGTLTTDYLLVFIPTGR